MQQTANYNLNLPEGTDVVNPLVDYNPNFSTIDGAMKANADRTVGRATCIKSGTTHVVTRSNTGSNIINFTATGDWNEGDTMTIDSTIVSVFLPDGTAALDGAYLINTEVFGILNGIRFTLYSNVVDIPEQSAANTSYDNTVSGLSANNVQGAIDEVAGLIGNAEYITATLNTIDWDTNASKIIKLNNLVIIHYYVRGVPTANKPLISGLPLPSGTAASVYSSGATPSIVGVDASGNLSVISSGSASAVFLTGVYVYVAA